MKQKVTAALTLLIIILTCRIFFPEPVQAASSEWTTAEAFVRTYGNAAVFHSVSDTDGDIYFGTMANTSNAGTTYRLEGWKINLKDQEGETLQELYVKLGGRYLRLVDEQKKGGYGYRLYSMNLEELKDRLKPEVLDAVEAGECTLTLDACISVAKRGISGGSISDDGSVSGRIYTDYEGICSAAAWSKTSREALKNYFGKTVEGLILGTKAPANRAPVLSAGPVYLRREDIQSGIFHPEELQNYFSAEDEEDGSLQVQITDYDLSLFSRSEGDDSFPLTISAVDSEGAKTMQEVMIYIMETPIKSGSQITGRIRFISNTYFEDEEGKIIPPTQGGLMEGSVWAADENFRKLLRNILNYGSN